MSKAALRLNQPPVIRHDLMAWIVAIPLGLIGGVALMVFCSGFLEAWVEYVAQ